MNRLRSGFVRAGVLWTLALLGAAALATVQAIWSLNDAQQACFFHYPAIPCPAADDPAMTQLAVAFFAVPAVWLAGIGLLVLTRAVRRRRRPPRGGTA